MGPTPSRTIKNMGTKKCEISTPGCHQPSRSNTQRQPKGLTLSRNFLTMNNRNRSPSPHPYDPQNGSFQGELISSHLQQAHYGISKGRPVSILLISMSRSPYSPSILCHANPKALKTDPIGPSTQTHTTHRVLLPYLCYIRT